MKKIILIGVLSFGLAGCFNVGDPNQVNNGLDLEFEQETPPTSQEPLNFEVGNNNISSEMEEPIVAKEVILKTSKGDIRLKLYPDQAPKTVSNFVGLATGQKEWVDPNTGQTVSGKNFYDGLTFHRVIEDFMIQGGDPLGTGSGDPGYRFEDEVDETLVFDRPGLLAMANSGPNTNGSQFFITHVPTPWLNGKHTIFGEVIEGMDVVNSVEQGDTIVNVTVIEE